MADISQYLQAIMSAVYGEDVRGSIHDAIALINDVGEAVLTLGTAVDSPTSPTTGFYQDSVYLNTATGDMWTCTGTGWSLSGNTRGAQGDPGLAATINVGTVTSGAVASVTNSGTTSAAVFDFVLPKGDKGDTGDGLTAESSHSGTNTTVNIINVTTQQVVDSFDVPDGVPGATGNGIASIAKTATAGLVDTYTITYTDGTSTTFTVTNGQDGQGAGDMTKVAYDPTNSVADAGGIPAYVSAHGGTTYTGEKGVIVAGTTIKAALVNDTASSLASQTISATQNRQYAVNLDNNSKLSVNVPWENTTYNPATTSTDGLMSAADKVAVNGIANKADKVASAISGNFAGLDSNGNLTDSEKKASDFMASDGVTANPTGTATGNLTSIEIGGTKYNIPSGGGSLDDLSDVNIDTSTLADGQFLQYDSASLKWVNKIDIPSYIIKTVTVYSAASDTLSFTDSTGAKTVTTDSSGVGTASILIPVEEMGVTFTSSVAKNPSNQSQAYSKTVTVTNSTNEIYVMPGRPLYWYGYIGFHDLHTVDSLNINTGYGTTNYQTPTVNTNSMSFVTSQGGDAVFYGDSVDVTNYSALKLMATKISGPNEGILIGIGALSTQNYVTDGTGFEAMNTTNPITNGLDISSYTGNHRISVAVYNTRSYQIDAFWLE